MFRLTCLALCAQERPVTLMPGMVTPPAHLMTSATGSGLEDLRSTLDHRMHSNLTLLNAGSPPRTSLEFYRSTISQPLTQSNMLILLPTLWTGISACAIACRFDADRFA